MSQAVDSGLIDAVQVIYNIFDQNPEDELFPACREHGRGCDRPRPLRRRHAHRHADHGQPLARGRLAQLLLCAGEPRSSVARAEALRPLIPDGMTMPEMALRFILNRPTVSTIIPGMRKISHVEANMAASDAGPLAPALPPG